jgi:Tol biopolymer transport system component
MARRRRVFGPRHAERKVDMQRRLMLGFMLALLCAGYAEGQDYFGKNKIQYRDFHWRVMKTEHFDVYFYGNEEPLALMTAPIVEQAHDRLSEDLKHELSRRIPVLIYDSHNDFQQTNVILDLIEESVGGFTESFKNRVVVPYTGSYAEFRHVLAHELTHAFLFDILYGSSLESILSRQYLFQLPLWFSEGLAEFESLGWDSEADMFLRDAVFSERLIPILDLDYTGGYILYKEGQSFFRHVADRFGREKVGELLHQVKYTRDLDKAALATLGSDVKTLQEEWARSLKREYFPLIADRRDPADFARRLTDHQRDGSYWNFTPALSPDGQKIAFLSDRSGYADLYLMSSVNGRVIEKLVKGERTSEFESMHTLRSSISWSPDGRKICFAAASGGRDLVSSLDLETHARTSRAFDLDGVFTPAFSPDGKWLAFVGLKDGCADIYVAPSDGSRLQRLTHDLYDDRDPAWSPDGASIVFSSDRPALDSLPADTFRFGAYSVYAVNADGSGLALLVEGGRNLSPRLSLDQKHLLFLSDRTGVGNLYRLDLETDSLFQLTDVLTGISSFSWSRDGARLAFSSYQKGGWDVFIVRDPLDSLPLVPVAPNAPVPPTVRAFYASIPRQPGIPSKKAPLVFSPDWVGGSIGYSRPLGLSGQSQIALSDILGNHRLEIVTDFVNSLDNSNYQFTYLYLPRRIDYGFTFLQRVYYLVDDYELVGTERQTGAGVLVSYPLNRFQRLDFEFDALSYSWDSSSFVLPRMVLLLPQLAFVTDNTLWGSTGPVDGGRYYFGIQRTADFLGSDLSYTTTFIDLRKYLRYGRRFGLAFRLLGAASTGRDPDRFWIGGSQTLRGYDDYEFNGTHVAVLNAEFRFPFVDNLKFAVPPLLFRNIRGAAFLDVGGAWDDTKAFKGATVDPDGTPRLQDWKAGVGVGLRARISFLVLRLDFAKRTDFASLSSGSTTHFGLGSEF